MSPSAFAWLPVFALAAGCSSVDAGAPLAQRALAALGLAAPPSRAVTIEIQAAATLNAAADGTAVPTRVQLHWLRDPGVFLRAPYPSFDTGGAAAAEHLLLPGARIGLSEAAPADARALGLVVLFRSPAPGRWRYAFDLAAGEPIRVALHQCAIAVVAGRAIGAAADAARVGDSPCPPGP